jgi:large conductance mechanosensitive channel
MAINLNPVTKASSLFQEFKAFAFKGNVVDLAVGVIIGAAFAKIIDSLVKNVMMPLISLIFPSDQPYTEWVWVIDGKTIAYGLFIGEVLNFLIVALALFIFIVKFLGLLMREKKKDATPPAPPATPADVVLLEEIRDILKANGHAKV